MFANFYKKNEIKLILRKACEVKIDCWFQGNVLSLQQKRILKYG